MVQLSGNYFFVGPGDKAFLVASNFTNYIEIGRPASDGFFLVGVIEEAEFVVSGRLFDEEGHPLCELDRNNLKHSDLRVQHFPEGGYEVTTSEGDLVIRLALTENDKICILQGKFFNEDGELVADGENDLHIYKGPAVIGKSGSARGLVIE